MPAQVFISYARRDNVTPPDDPKTQGFVTFLKGQLLFEFDRLGSPAPELWMDLEEIESAQQFGTRIPDALDGSALLVVVASRNWLDRPWCRKELDAFAEQRKQVADNDLRERIIVVSLHDLPEEDVPPLLRGQEGYRFFTPGPKHKPGTEELFFDRGEIKDPQFKTRVRSLAKYLWSQAQAVDGKPQNGAAVAVAAPAPAASAPPAPAAAQQNLRDCESVLLCWGTASEVWVRATARELAEWRKLGRTAQFSCRSVVACPPPGDRKAFLLKLPPRNEVDIVVDLTAEPPPYPDKLRNLVRKDEAQPE